MVAVRSPAAAVTVGKKTTSRCAKAAAKAATIPTAAARARSQKHERASAGCPFFVAELVGSYERGAAAALVVITTTPYEASGPYCLSAARPLITSTAAIWSLLSDGN